jgi:type III pantothenate kinase
VAHGVAVILLVDAGNSAVKWGTLALDGALADGGRVVHRDGADLATLLQTAWSQLHAIDRVIGCAVAGPKVVDAVDRIVARLGWTPVEWLRAQSRFAGRSLTLVNRYRDPAQLGTDRWHAALGACVQRPGTSLVVVNAGTATTVDCVRHRGETEFIGGCIAPGVRLMLESLARGTAGLPLADGATADFPASTDQAIMTGVLDAQAGLVERVWHRFTAALGAAPALLVGGGHADAIVARLAADLAPAIEHNLVLRGLALRANA